MVLDNAGFEAIRRRPAYRAALWCNRLVYVCFPPIFGYFAISMVAEGLGWDWWPGFEAVGPEVFLFLLPTFLVGVLGLLTARSLYLRVGIRMDRNPSGRIGLRMDDPVVAMAVERDVFFRRRRPLYVIAPTKRRTPPAVG